MAEEEKKTTPPPEAPKEEIQVTFTPEEVADGKGIAWLSYISWLWVFPFFMKKENNFVKAHVKMGLILFILEIIVSFVCVIPYIGWLIGAIVWIFCVVLAIMGIVSAAKGEFKKLPLVGDMALKMFKF